MKKDTILERINRAALRFLRPLTIQETFSVILEEACKLVDGDMGYIALEERGKLKLVYVSHKSLKYLKIRRKGYTYTAYSKHKAFVVHAQEYFRFHPELVEMGMQSAILIPLFYHNRSFGTLSVFSTKSDTKFTSKELNTLRLFGSMATLAIRKTQLYDETRQALESRDMFLSMAAHEFRTPITTISGYAQLLRLKLLNSHRSEMVRRWSDEIYTETMRLNRLVIELLEAQRIRSGLTYYLWKETSLRLLLNKVIANFTIARPDHKIKLVDNLNGEDRVIGDPDKLFQVFMNILDNAAKFSPPQEEIMVELKAKKDRFSVNIKDQGSGISKNDQKNIFKGFYRGTSNQKEGMGLGLYICKEIIDKHKGGIKIKSKPNQGTNVEVSLPKSVLS